MPCKCRGCAIGNARRKGIRDAGAKSVQYDYVAHGSCIRAISAITFGAESEEEQSDSASDTDPADAEEEMPGFISGSDTESDGDNDDDYDTDSDPPSELEEEVVVEAEACWDESESEDESLDELDREKVRHVASSNLRRCWRGSWGRQPRGGGRRRLKEAV